MTNVQLQPWTMNLHDFQMSWIEWQEAYEQADQNEIDRIETLLNSNIKEYHKKEIFGPKETRLGNALGLMPAFTHSMRETLGIDNVEVATIVEDIDAHGWLGVSIVLRPKCELIHDFWRHVEVKFNQNLDIWRRTWRWQRTCIRAAIVP